MCLLLLVLAVTTFNITASAQTGYWHTSGNQILDSSNKVVRIAGINWYGFETTDEVAHGLWAQDYHYILDAIHSNGYNVVRIPFSNQMVESPIIPSNISYQNGSGPINTDLKGLNSLQILDKIIAYAGQIGLRVISTIIAPRPATAPKATGSGTPRSIPRARGSPTGCL